MRNRFTVCRPLAPYGGLFIKDRLTGLLLDDTAVMPTAKLGMGYLDRTSAIADAAWWNAVTRTHPARLARGLRATVAAWASTFQSATEQRQREVFRS